MIQNGGPSDGEHGSFNDTPSPLPPSIPPLLRAVSLRRQASTASRQPSHHLTRKVGSLNRSRSIGRSSGSLLRNHHHPSVTRQPKHHHHFPNIATAPSDHHPSYIVQISISEWKKIHTGKQNDVDDDHEDHEVNNQEEDDDNENHKRSTSKKDSSYTVFSIDVKMSNGESFRTDRRFRTFRSLHQSIKRLYGADVVQNLSFPRRRVWGNNSTRIIEQRKNALEEYLKALLAIRPRVIELNSFLEVPQHAVETHLVLHTAKTQKDGSSEGTSEDGDSSHNNMNSETVADSFSFLKVLGKGSFGKVYLVRYIAENNNNNQMPLLAMKVLKKESLRRRQQILHTQTERKLMGKLRHHPFIARLRFAFQSHKRLYIVSDYCCGGELFFHLKKFRTFSEDMARFYIAELIDAISHLHANGIVYRDLKPENILLDCEGHVCITDFGMSKEGTSSRSGASSFCGTPEYVSPEMIQCRKGAREYGTSVDYWSLGTLLFEMLTGWPPFFNRNVKVMCDKILKAPLVFPSQFGISDDAKSVISGLLCRNPDERLGCRPSDASSSLLFGVEELKAHRFFKTLDWEALHQRKVKPPFRPRLSDPTDIQYFDKEFTNEKPSKAPQKDIPLADGSNSVDFPNFYFKDEDNYF